VSTPRGLLIPRLRVRFPPGPPLLPFWRDRAVPGHGLVAPEGGSDGHLELNAPSATRSEKSRLQTRVVPGFDVERRVRAHLTGHVTLS
jgi:hypothetical protein